LTRSAAAASKDKEMVRLAGMLTQPVMPLGLS
jgi:hypothetical protein